MKIAVYYPWVYLTSGVERTILEMCRRSRHQYTIFTNHYEPENTYPEFRDLEVIVLPYIPVRRQIMAVMTGAIRIASQKLDLRGYDALLVHCDGLGNSILNRSGEIPAVCMCHTPLRAVFDPHYKAQALSRLGAASKLAYEALSSTFVLVDRRMFRRYRYVVFNSEETLKRARQGGLLQAMEGRHGILHPGVDCQSLQPTWRYERYFLVAGRIMWTKNIEVAIEAFLRFKRRAGLHDGFRLVIAGRVDKKSEVYIEKLRSMAAGRTDIDFVVSPSDEVLRRLYSECYGLLFPAFNEDWGIVPLEANAFGKPVVATDRGGPAESQRNNETGLLVSCDADAFAGAMWRLAEEPELVRAMGIKARAASLQYDWANFVDGIESVLQAVVSGHEPGIRLPEQAKQAVS